MGHRFGILLCGALWLGEAGGPVGGFDIANAAAQSVPPAATAETPAPSAEQAGPPPPAPAPSTEQAGPSPPVPAPAPVSPPKGRGGHKGLLVGGVVLGLVGIGLVIPGAVLLQKPELQTPEGAVGKNLLAVPLLCAGGISLGLGGLAILIGAPSSAPLRD